jgi:inorganic pyrophosphatase
MTSGGWTTVQLLVLTLFASLGGVAQAATDEPVGPLAYAQPADTREFFVVVEIPAGSFTKYEIEPQSGFVIVDRFQQMPVVYPANYGSVASSLAGDGDHLDALVLTREPVVPGALIRVRTIGVLRMIDGGEPDDKLITVPVSGVDPTYDPIRSIGDLPEIERQRIAAFFEVYKALPAGRKIVELGGFGDAEEAQSLVDAAILAAQAR